MKAGTGLIWLSLYDQNLEQYLALSKHSIKICLLADTRLGTSQMMKEEGKDPICHRSQGSRMEIRDGITKRSLTAIKGW